MRRSISNIVNRHPLAESHLVASSSLSPPKSASAAAAPSEDESGTDVIGPLPALKAFGIATFIVTTGALFSVFAVKKTMGVETVSSASSHNPPT